MSAEREQIQPGRRLVEGRYTVLDQLDDGVHRCRLISKKAIRRAHARALLVPPSGIEPELQPSEGCVISVSPWWREQSRKIAGLPTETNSRVIGRLSNKQ